MKKIHAMQVVIVALAAGAVVMYYHILSFQWPL